MNLDAILRIGTKVTGTEQISQLQGKLKAAEGAAESMASRAGLLSGALGAVVPAVTIGGLGALIGKTIEAGDALNDMSQRTGVSVEALAKFKKAAATSGTDIEAVSKSLVKLDRGLFNIGGKGDKVGPALDRLGISAKDAAGNLKSADQITLEVANRFKAMPDGVEKTATALDLFGKAGADMIPMLNMGGQAIDSLSIKMTTAFAQKADEYNDKLAMLSGKVGGLAAGLTVALLPALDAIATGLTAVVDGFSKLPGPVQAIIGSVALLAISLTALAPIFASLITVAAAFEGLAIGATIAGWLGAIGPLITAAGTLVAGIVGWPLTIGAALVAVGVLIFAFRDQIGAVLAGIGKTIYGAVDTINKGIRSAIKATWDWVASGVTGIGDALSRPFIGATEVIKSVLRSVLGFAAGAINGFLGMVNRLIATVNGVAASLHLPQLPQLGMMPVPQFASGAYVTGATTATVGEAGPEYVIPAARMGAASRAYLQGSRGVAVVNGADGSAAAPTINIQTGQVLQMPDGSQWVSMADLERAMHATAAGVLGQLRTPAGRVAMGGA